MKIKTMRAHWYDATREPFGDFVGDVVPAAVAQQLLEALIRLRNATERMMRGKPTVMDEAISEADAAIAAATEEE